MQSLSRVRIFIEVARLESFSAAGRELGMSGAAVSKQVQNLEGELGVRLLNRTTRHVSLTEEGALYYQGASRALADLQETEQRLLELKDCPTGKLKVNAPMSFGSAYLCQPIAQFAKQFPDVELEVDFDDRWVDVIGEGYDVVVRIGVLQDSSLKARKLADCPLWLCASPECIEREGEITTLEQLKDHPAATYNLHGQAEYWNYSGPEGNGSIKLRKVFSANVAEMQLQACLAGVGVAILPAFTVGNYIQDGRLVRVLPDYSTQPQRGIYAVFPPDRENSVRVRLFIDALIAASSEFHW